MARYIQAHCLVTSFQYKVEQSRRIITTLKCEKNPLRAYKPTYSLMMYCGCQEIDIRFSDSYCYYAQSFAYSFSFDLVELGKIVTFIRVATIVASSYVECCRRPVLCTPCTHNPWQHMGVSQVHIIHL